MVLCVLASKNTAPLHAGRQVPPPPSLSLTHTHARTHRHSVSLCHPSPFASVSVHVSSSLSSGLLAATLPAAARPRRAGGARLHCRQLIQVCVRGPGPIERTTEGIVTRDSDQPEALVGTRHRDRRACLPGWRARALRSESGFPGKPGRPVGPGLRVRWPGNPGLRLGSATAHGRALQVPGDSE